MANLRLNTTLRNNRLDAISDFAGTNAVIKIMSGTQPAGGGAETTVLATLACSFVLAGAAVSGVLTLNAISPATVANSGTATWFRLETSGGVWVLDGDVSTIAAGTGNLQIDTVALASGGTLSLTGPNTITEGYAA